VPTDLSARERQILTALYDGRSTGEIAKAAGISESTVEWHVASLERKVHVHTRAELMVMAYRRGLVEEPPHASALAEMRVERARAGRPRAIAEAVMRWAIALAIVLLALVGLSGAATSLPLFRVGPPSIIPTLVPPTTTSPRP
jgi:DNA-binding CsgD family transcriptional regulator